MSILYANLMFKIALGIIVNYSKAKSNKDDKIIFLALCANLLSYE
jgi:hypothetical protein